MKNINTITVYLGSSGSARPVFKEAAMKLGALIADSGKHLVYGGMDAGLMGLVASDALAHGGKVTGIIPTKIKDSERILKNLTETILVDELSERKALMFQKADAVLALPGGFGTLDESLEVLYWGKLGLHNKPLVLINTENYWNAFIGYIRSLPDFDERFLIVVNDVTEAFSALDNWQAPAAPEKEILVFPHFEDEILRDTHQPILVDEATVENSYYLVCALGLKQLGKHSRAIGILNDDQDFDGLLEWFETAQRETFITPKCLQLYDSDNNEAALKKRLETQENVHIDLHMEKWGDRRKKPRD